MNENDKIMSRLKKLLALAERGEGGEQENAQRILDKLLKKHGLSLTDITDDARTEHWIHYNRTANGRKLLSQVIYSVCGERDQWSTQSRRQCIGVECTKLERVQIDLHYDTYQAALKQHLDVAYHAFIERNQIFPEGTKNESDTNMDIDWEYWLNVARMADSMDAVVVQNRLPIFAKEIGLGTN